MQKEIVNPYFLNRVANSWDLDIPKDSATSDNDLKLKLRSIDLIKYNPNLFTNKQKNGFFNIIGGEKSIILTLSMGVLFSLYRFRLNSLRQSSHREGIWMYCTYFAYGSAMGAFYSACFFWRWQVHFNDIIANWILKRYKDSKELNRTNIYKYKELENHDECYNFSNKYFNHAHI